jgi:hypothetical protein
MYFVLIRVVYFTFQGKVQVVINVHRAALQFINGVVSSTDCEVDARFSYLFHNFPVQFHHYHLTSQA